MRSKSNGWVAGGAIYAMVVVSANAFFALWKDGGARPEGYSNFTEYVGPLTLVPYIWAVFSMIVCAFILNGQRWRLPVNALGGLSGFVVVMLISILWSDDPLEAGKVFIPIFAGFCLIVCAGLRYGLALLLRYVEAALLTIVIMSYCYSIFIPTYGIAQGVHDGLWQGVFSHKNNLGNFSLLAAAFYFIRWVFERRLLNALLCLASSVLVYMSGSTASLMGLGVLFGLFLFYRFFAVRISRRQRVLVMRIGVLFFVFFTVFLVAFTFLMPDIQILEKDSSFSGRDLIWGFFLLRALDSPLFGYGLGQISMGNVSLVDSISDYVGFVASSTHNGFIDALYSVGLIGIIFLFRYLLTICKYSESFSAFTVLWFGLIPLLFVNSFESRLLSFNLYILFFVLYGMWAREFAILEVSKRRPRG